MDKIYLIFKIFSGTPPDRDNYITTKSPPEQYSTSKTKKKETREEIKPLSEYKIAIIVFDDILGSSNIRYIDQFYMRGRHNTWEVFYLSEFYFVLQKRTFRNNSHKIVLFNQTFKVIGKLYRDVGGYDMSYDEYKQLFRETWKAEYIYLCIDTSKKIDLGRYCICDESKNTYTEFIPETKHFWLT